MVASFFFILCSSSVVSFKKTYAIPLQHSIICPERGDTCSSFSVLLIVCSDSIKEGKEIGLQTSFLTRKQGEEDQPFPARPFLIYHCTFHSRCYTSDP